MKTVQLFLHYASAYGHTDIVEYLLSLDAFDINAMDHTLLSPLHCAASHRHPKVLEMLLKYGADHAVRDLEDRTPVYMCVESSLYSTFSNKLSDATSRVVVVKVAVVTRKFLLTA